MVSLNSAPLMKALVPNGSPIDVTNQSMRLNPLRHSFRLALWAACLTWSGAAASQTIPCDQGVIRLPDRTGTVTICSGLSARVPQLARQLKEAARQIGEQGAQVRELTRLVKGLNAVSSNLDTARQARMLASLSAELLQAQQAGGERPLRLLTDVADNVEVLRDRLIHNLSQEHSATDTRAALRGKVGDAIAQLELRSATRQLDEIKQRLVALQSDVSEVKSGVASANETLKRIETAVDPAKSADRCADLECALTEGASASTIQKLFDKGARLPTHPLILGQLLIDGALTSRPDRYEVLDILVRQGVDLGVRFKPMLFDARLLSSDSRQLADGVWRVARLAESPIFARSSIASGDKSLDLWNQMVSCLTLNGTRLNLREMAALTGDVSLYRYLSQRGVPLSTQELRCEARLSDGTLTSTRLQIDSASGKVDVISQ